MFRNKEEKRKKWIFKYMFKRKGEKNRKLKIIEKKNLISLHKMFKRSSLDRF